MSDESIAARIERRTRRSSYRPRTGGISQRDALEAETERLRDRG